MSESNEELEFFRDSVRKFLSTEVPEARIRELAGDPRGFDPNTWIEGAALGFTSMCVPESLGGGSLGGGLADLAIVAEEFGRHVAPGPFVSTNVVAAAIAEGGSPLLRAEVLPRLVSGEATAAWAAQESAGWGFADLACELRPTDAGFALHGEKIAVEGGMHADYLLVTAHGESGLVQYLIAAEASGVSRRPMQSLDLVRRFAAVTFDAVPVDDAVQIASEAGAAVDVERQSRIAWVLSAAESAGAAAQVFETTLPYMFDRFSFGRPLASYQALKHRFADMAMWLEACLAVGHGAARAVAEDRADAGELARAAKAYVGDHANAIVQDCIQMHGGMGVTWEHDAHLYLRRVTQNRGLYGTPADHREALAEMMGMGGEVAA